MKMSAGFFDGDPVWWDLGESSPLGEADHERRTRMKQWSGRRIYPAAIVSSVVACASGAALVTACSGEAGTSPSSPAQAKSPGLALDQTAPTGKELVIEYDGKFIDGELSMT